MGGALSVGNKTPAAEFNMLIDPQGAEFVLNNAYPIPLAMVNLEVTHTCIANESVQQKILSIDTEFAKIMLKLIK